MPISDLIYNSDLAQRCGCGSIPSTPPSSSTPDNGNSCNCNNGAVCYFVPPPYIDVTKYPYPPLAPCCPPPPPVPPECPTVKPSAAEKSICKLSKKASAVRQLIENLEEKNKPLIIKSGSVSYNLGTYRTVDPEAPEDTVEDEDIETIINILKAELENIKEEIKKASDALTEE